MMSTMGHEIGGESAVGGGENLRPRKEPCRMKEFVILCKETPPLVPLAAAPRLTKALSFTLLLVGQLTTFCVTIVGCSFSPPSV